MKAISIKQPWASLTAAGIRTIDVSNRDTQYRGPLLILASSRRVGRSYGEGMNAECLCMLFNAQACGTVPYNEEMPLSAAIGVVELTDCTPTAPLSPWAGNGQHWVLSQAQVLEEPIVGVQGKQGLFEVECVKAEDLPPMATSLKLCSWYTPGCFHLTMTEKEIERQTPDLPLVLLHCSDGLTEAAFIDSQSTTELQPIHTLVLHTPDKEVALPVKRTESGKEQHFGHNVQYLAFYFELRPKI